MLAKREFPTVRRSAWIFSLIAFFLFAGAAQAAFETHSASDGLPGSTKRRQDRDELVKRLTDVVSRSTVSRPKPKSQTQSIFRLVAADDARVKEAETQGIPAKISIVALNVENGLTPKELNDLVQKLKTGIGADAITVAARELARRLLAPPSKLRDLYKNADGSFDFDALTQDLGLDSADLRERAAALKKALEEDLTAPLQEEKPADPNAPKDSTVTPDQIDPGEEVVDPTQFVDENGLDDTVLNQDDLVFDDNAQNQLAQEEARRKAAEEAAKNADKGKDGKNGKGAGAAKAPPPPPPGIPPISIPPIGGGEKPPPPLPMPPPSEIPPPPPPLAIQPPPQGDGLSPELLSLLLAKGKTGERPPDAGMQDILATFASMNQQTIQMILQLGSTMLMAGAGRTQITATPPAGRSNVYGQGGNMTARLQSSSGYRTSVTAGPRSSPSGSTIANSMQAQSPRQGTVPGFGTTAAPRTSSSSATVTTSAVNQGSSSQARWIVKPRKH